MAAGFHAGFRRYALLTPPAWLRAVDGGAVRQVRRRGHGRPGAPARGSCRAGRALVACAHPPPRVAPCRRQRRAGLRAARRCWVARAARRGSVARAAAGRLPAC